MGHTSGAIDVLGIVFTSSVAERVFLPPETRRSGRSGDCPAIVRDASSGHLVIHDVLDGRARNAGMVEDCG